MFTVLIRNKCTKDEILYLSDEVKFSEENGLTFTIKDGRGCHFIPSDKEQDYRDIFVMNSSGQTVARYLL